MARSVKMPEGAVYHTLEKRLEYGSNIPAARELLIGLYDRLMASGSERITRYEAATIIEEALGMMTRRKPVQVAPRQNKPVTAEVKAHIKELAATNPDWTMQNIAVAAGTNSGRVSEVLNGLR